MKSKQYEEVVGDEDNPSVEEDPGHLLIHSMAELIELECPVGGCVLGQAGAKYRTPKLDHDKAMRMLELHAKSHDQVRLSLSTTQFPSIDLNVYIPVILHLVNVSLYTT